jgi:hypothetical protein
MRAKNQTVNRLFLSLLVLAGICQGREIEEASQPFDVKSMPIIKNLFYGFEFIDITRGLEGEIDFELSSTFLSRHMINGIDMTDDHGVVIPTGTVIFGDSGFSAKVIHVYPISNNLVASIENNYAAFYTGSFLEDTPWATHFTLNYFYFGKPNIGGHKNDAREIGSTFFWPQFYKLGNGYITPNYYVGHFGASKSNSNIRNSEGFIHIFGLNYDFEVSEFWPSGDKQAFRLSGNISYNDGYAGAVIEHDWSHAVLGISTSIQKGNLTITPMLNYQISMEETVNTQNELWSGINVTYRF